MHLMRSEARKETYLRVFELALLDGAPAAKAHEIAFEASWKEWP
jgi:hypothetical protein